MKKLFSSFLYAFLCILTVLVGSFLLSIVLDGQTLSIVLKTAIYTICGISLGLSLWLKQDKSFFLLLLTILAYTLIEYFSNHRFDNNYYTLIAYPLMCLLFPINVYLMTRVKQDDLFLHAFIRKVVVIFGQIFLLYIVTYLLPSLFGESIFKNFQYNLSNLLNHAFVGSQMLSMPQMGLLSFIVCFALCLWTFRKKSTFLDTAFIGVFTTSFISFYFIYERNISTIFFLAAVTCVLFSLLQISHRMAFLDELTNIPGRRALTNALRQYERHPYTLSIMDIDFFKRLNDSYGHEVGDQGLRMISARLSQYAKSGHIYRYGGEEFVLLFPYKHLEEVLDEIEETRALISNSDFFLRSRTRCDNETENEKYPYLASIKITLSAGVAEKVGSESSDFVLNMADQALYKAKKTGRNKTVYYKNDKFYELY